uniref:Uncharacterized protein n=1 Tax=Arion vulgaris TaxID=1028688 RepID=A0A0B6ZXF5_9EUPU
MCGAPQQFPEHFLQDCPNLKCENKNLATETTLQNYGRADDDLKRITLFMTYTGVVP